MKGKTKEDYTKIGFRYEDDEDRLREFNLAKAYYELYPNEVKIRRKMGHHDWIYVLTLLHEKRLDLVPDLEIAKANLPKHSYFNKRDASDPRKKKVWALGRFIAEGSSGRVKHSMDEDGVHTIDKIELSNTESQQKETHILRDLGLLVSEKITRKGGNTGTQDKYYTGAVYLGPDLATRCKAKELNDDQLVSVLRKTAWVLHQWHTGAAFKSTIAHAHCDIKPENITLADNGKVVLTDPGLAKRLSENVRVEGTWEFLPTDRPQLLRKNLRVEFNHLSYDEYERLESAIKRVLPVSPV